MAKRPHSVFSRLLLFISLSILFIIALAVVLGYAYEDKIKQFSVQQINKSVDAKIKVDVIELSFLSHFPNASLDFKNVGVFSKDSTIKDVLIDAKHIYLSFDIFDILKENYSLKELVLEDATVNLAINAKGEHNLHIIKNSNDDKDSTKFFLNLSSVNILSSTFNYTNEATKQSLNLLVKKAKLNGNFTSENFKINLIGKNIIERFVNNNREIIIDKSVDLDVVFTAEPNSGIYNLSKGNISYQGIKMDLTGNLSIYKNALKVNATVKANNLDIENAIKNLPSESKASFKDYNPKGLISLEANVNGYIGGSEIPHIQFVSNLQKASFSIKEPKLSFNNLQLKLEYNNGKNSDLKSSTITIDKLQTGSNLGNVRGDIKIANLWKPQIKMDLISKLNLEDVKEMLKVDTIRKMSGNADIHSWINLSLSYIDSTDSWGLNNISMDHNFTLENASFAFNNSQLEYDSINATGRIEDNNISVKNLVLNSNNTVLKGSISINNLPIDLFQKPAQKINIIGDISSNHLTFKQLVAAFPSSESTDSRFSNNIYLNLNLHIGSFQYDKISASNVEGRLLMNNRKLYSNSITLNAFEGNIKASFLMDGSEQGVYHFISDGNISKVNISTAFNQLNNFGQETITDKNIKGSLLSTYNLKTDFDENWDIIKPSVEMSSELELSNGELVDMTSLNALKDYTKIDDFSNIHFSTLKNNIYIKNEKITIPDMEIHSDKMNIDLKGVHDFDNKYEYHFVVLLSEVLGKHYQQRLETEFGEVENDGYGKTRLFFTMKGQGENFDVKYDRSGLGNKLKGDLKEEKESLKNALKEEFGLFKTDEEKAKAKNDSLKINPKEKEKEQIKKQEEGKFILEWDEDDG